MAIPLVDAEDYFWAVSNEGVRFGTKMSNAYSYGQVEEGLSLDSEGIYTIFDTGASDIYLSVLWFESFVEKLYEQAGISYEIKEGKATSKCDDEEFPDIYFSFDYNWV